MEKELAALVYDYEKGSKSVDEAFIKDAEGIINNFYGTDLKVNLIDSILLFQRSLSKYYIDNGVINLHKRNIEKEMSEEIAEAMPHTFSHYYEYIYYLEILLKEFQHALQYTKIRTDNNIEGIITNEEINLFNTNVFPKNISDFAKGYQYQKSYSEFHDCSPINRIANKRSAEICGNVAFFQNDDIAVNSMLIDYYNSILSGYDKVDLNEGIKSPTKLFFNSLGTNINWEEIDLLSENEPLDKKAELGLEVDKEYIKFLESENEKAYNKLIRSKK